MPHSFSQIFKKFITTSIVIGVASAQLVLSAFISPANVTKAAESTHLVISQIQVSGATEDDQFVELYNPTNTAVTMSGWQLARENSSGSGSLDNLVLALNGTVPAHGYFLIIDGKGYDGSTLKDAQYSAQSNHLLNNYTVLLYDAGALLVDKVGFGTAPDFKNSPAINPPTGGSLIRLPADGVYGNGIDNGDNSRDFTTLVTSNPRNSLSPAQQPLPAVLDAPINLELTPTQTSITASWDIVASATRYNFSITPTPAGYSAPSTTYGATRCSATFSGLTSGTLYEVGVKSSRPSDNTASPTFATANATTLTATLDKPIITPVLMEINQLVISWGAVTSADNYIVHYTPAEGATQSTDLLPNSQLSATLSGLTGGTLYYITVEASAAGLPSAISDAVTGTPLSPSVITVNPNLVFYNNGVASTSFGAGAQVITTVTFDSAVSASDNPALTLTRPGAGPVPFVLTQTGANEWQTTTAFDVAATDLVVQDGTVVASISFGTADLVAGTLTNGSFIADTTASVPTITLYQNAPGTEDALKFVTTEPETIRVYRDSSLADSSLIVSATTDANNIASTTIGDNKFATLYIVAEDLAGNFTPALLVQNDISAPVTPAPKSVNANGNITVSWPAVSGATSYIVRWRDIDPTPWSQIVTTDTSYTFAANPSAIYEVQVSAVDSAGNVSSAIDMNVTTPAAVVVATASASTANEQQLFGAMATTSFIQTDGNKDGSLSPVANTNSTPTPTPTSTSQSSSSNSSSQPQDLSKAIVILAIVLILAGIAIAAYSWYQGGEQTDSTKPKTAEEPTPKAVTPVAKPVEKVAEKPKSTKPINQPTRRGRPRRKR